LEAIRQLLKVVTDNQLSELTISLRDGVAITIRADEAAPVAHIPANHASVTVNAPPQLTGPVLSPYPLEPEPRASRGTAVPSPMMGIFYESASPGDPPFIRVGDEIRVGQTIGLIEAMKVFSEVPSELAGRVLEVAAHNGEIVQLGQALLYVESG
jgi:acetyl-CoA carboxylase biotin carboxyl carrier protein